MIPLQVLVRRLAGRQCMDRVRDEVVGYFILVQNYVLLYTLILGMLLNASVCCYNPVDTLKRSIRDVVWLVTPKSYSR